MISDIHATITLNGFIADANGSEDLFDDSNWESMVRLSKNYSAVLWGRKTYENVVSWGNEYIDMLKHLTIFVLTKDKSKNNFNNIVFVNSLDDIKTEKLLVEGGKSVYELALQKLNIQSIYLNVVPVIINEGIPLIEKQQIIDAYNKIKIHEKLEKYIQISLSK